MAKKLIIGAGAGIASLFVLIGGVAIQTTTSDVANANPSTGAIGGDLKAGSVPPQFAPWIEKAAGACPGLPAAVLAAQLEAESNFNPNARSNADAHGIAQFIPGTWQSYAVDADNNGRASPYDPADAIIAQGRYMCDLLKDAKKSGIPGDPIELALAGYNAGWGAVVRFHGVPPRSFASGQTYDYVRSIMAGAKKFTAPAGPSGPVDLPKDFSIPRDAPEKVRMAVAWALYQKGGWYHLGGDCTNALGSNPAHWCDCSSLMEQAYRAAGISISRTTYAQVNEGQAVSMDAPLAGDLVFTPGSDGSASSPGHVGMYIGNGLVIEAPRTGVQTRIVPYSSWRNSSSPITRIVAVRRIVPQ
ncbi:bifunctional lytic transglycosylase/C40 family peptidase (plasmid) [Streptomyces sp. HU2014]|uniref:C40 family peptidase n=1 Tax=Streptomyces sp. HU2014 TaxID=2939414 RepID=UPI0020108918|nr:NlpC/P60 family protein [Streptomyces sp. HU2014]UQI49660.1 bifunctional lytic transglycosylase/C40 family peptidase [Streptomyces sp. HU2014]